MLIHSGLVVGEVLVDGESGLSGSVLHQLHHDLLNVSLDGIAVLPVDLVLLVGDVVLGVVAPPVTLGGGGPLRAGEPAAVDMMFARLYDVRLTALATAVLTTAHQTLPGPVGPGRPGEPAVTAEAAGVAAAEEVLRGDVDLGLTLGVDTDPVGDGGDGSEGPARATTSLVPDLLDGGTIRPGRPGVEAGGEVLRVSEGLQLGREVEVSVRVDPHQGTEVLVTGLWVETG